MKRGPSKLPPAEATAWWANFKQLLDESNDWPSVYIFKFIAPKEQIDELKYVFIGNKIDIKASSKGKYHSLTSKIMIESSEEVIDIYKRAGAIEGVISL